MNFIWHVYNVRGVDQTSGKKSKLKIIARDEVAAEREAANRGLMSPYTFTEIDFEEPTDRQISYAEDLGIKIMAGMNRKDISALIDKHNDNDTTPTDGLMTFAYEHDIYFSPYIGERALCNLLFNELSVEGKTAFFCYAVHQSMAGERLDNLDASPARGLIYQFADMYSTIDGYQRSLNEYSGSDLVVFGEAQGGGSKRKKAYQDTKSFLDALLPVEDDLLTDPDTGEVINFIPPDAEIPDDGFIVIGGQVAMPEETVAALLGVTIDRLHELSRSVNMDNRGGGIYVRGGKQYFASPKVIFKVRDANGKKSADLSNKKLFAVFDKAAARLTPEEHKKKTRRFWFKAGAVILAIFAYSHFSEPSKPSQNPTPPAKVEQTVPVEGEKSYSNGQFKIGVDLPAGEYLAVGTGYVEVTSAPELTAIIYNDNIENAQRYVDVRDGEYLKVEHALKLYALSDAPKISVQGKVPDGQFKVGRDIPAGEYKITLNAGGYFAVTKSPRNDFVTNQFTNEGGTYYATITDGQYLQIKKGFAEAATPVAPQVKQPATETKSAFDTAPARISVLPSIGATRADFDSSYTATNKNGVGYIRYNQDVWHAQFLNDSGDDSDDKNARAYIVMVQVLPGLPLSMAGIEDLIPADAENVQYDSSGSDNVVRVQNFTGTSEQLKSIFPHSNGKFGGGFNWDAATGKFIGGTIMVENPFLPSK